MSPSSLRGSSPPHPACAGCHRSLPLSGITQLWTYDDAEVGPSSGEFAATRHLVAEATCPGCGYPNYLTLPHHHAKANNPEGNLFGLPDDLADRVIACAIGRMGARVGEPAAHFLELARFWSLAHRLAVTSNARQVADDPAA